jgi:hypothetical protein
MMESYFSAVPNARMRNLPKAAYVKSTVLFLKGYFKGKGCTATGKVSILVAFSSASC